jgi:hypothetical protein
MQFLGQVLGLPASHNKTIKYNSKKNLRGLSGLGRFFVAPIPVSTFAAADT